MEKTTLGNADEQAWNKLLLMEEMDNTYNRRVQLERRWCIQH